MSRAIAMLVQEHRLIEKVLASLEAFADAVEGGGEGARQAMAGYAEFFRGFADKCHHGKEEDRLLVRMVDHGLPADEGPRIKVLTEHTAGRACVRELAALGAGQGPLSPAEKAHLGRVVRDYVALLVQHIQKEDQLLFPMAEQMIPAAELEELADDFEAFERQVMGEETHRRLHEMAEELIAAHPPRARVTAA